MGSMHAVVEALGVTSISHLNITLEEHAQPALESDNETGILSLRNSHSGGINENGEIPDSGGATEDEEIPQELNVEPNIPLHVHTTPPAGAAGENLDDISLGGIGSTYTIVEQDLSIELDGERRESFIEPVSVDEVPSAYLPSHTVSSSGINEGAGLCTNDKITTNSQIILNSPFATAEDKADGTNCPICMEPWTGEGVHRICCLACGHLFGRSCIRRWLNQRGKKNSKCPHCNRKARVEDIRNLYVPSLTVIDDKNQQLLEELQVLQSKNERLMLQNEKYRKDCQNLEALLAASRVQNIARNKEICLSKRSMYNPQDSEIKRQKNVKTYNMDGNKIWKALAINNANFTEKFELQEEFSLVGARVFDMDAFSQMLLVAQKTPSGAFILNKISLLSLADTLMMPLPPCTGAVRDIRVAPPGAKLPGRLALVASLGKMVSLFSLESNNVVLTYKLQSPCWSCAWDPNEPNYVFAGLQDGGLTVFDLRQTSSPLGCLQSFSRQPVHTVYPTSECDSLQGKNRTGILSACTSGICFWDMSVQDVLNSRSHRITCSDISGVCVALAYNHLANVGVATFRDKPPALLPAGSMTQTTDVTSNGPIIIPSQPNTQQHSGHPSLRATHYPLAQSVHASVLQPNTQVGGGNLCCDDDGSSMAWRWKYGDPMFGNVSPIGMNRSAIVCSSCAENSSNLQAVFAFGDEETHALMLWDVNTLAVVDRLKAHRSAILDVKSMNTGEHAILGCISASTLQVYKK